MAAVWAAAGLVVFFLTAAVWADEIYLRNGNHLSGKLVSMKEGKLILETTFAGELTIDWIQVERMVTEETVTLVLNDGATLAGKLKPSESGDDMEFSLDSIFEPRIVELADIQAINPPDEPPVKFSGKINVGLNKASGNTDTENAHADAELIARAVKNRLTLGGTYNRASEDNQKTEDNATGYLKHDYFLTEKFYWYLKGMLERDKFKDINLRTTVGPGLGYQVFEGELMNLSVEAGPSYVNTDYDNAADEDSISGRWAVKFDRFFFEKLFQYYFSNEGYFSASDTSDVFMFTKTGLRFPLRGGLFFNLGWEWDWDNKPAEDTDKSDYRYILSLGYGF
jgi:putative salt-induced outer membrane protein YdiY